MPIYKHTSNLRAAETLFQYPRTMIFMDGGNTGDFKTTYFLKDNPTRLKTILQDFSSVLGMDFFRIFTNYVPTKLVAVTVTTYNYYYKPPVPKSKSKNILVEKDCNKPIEAQPI
jgi:hypothetical protein